MAGEAAEAEQRSRMERMENKLGEKLEAVRKAVGAAAIAATEERLNAKFATVIIEGEAREKRLEVEMDRREVQRKMAWEAKTEWDCEQWGRLADEMNKRKEEIEVIRSEMSALVRAPTPLPPQVPEQTPSRALRRALMPELTPAPPRRAPKSQTPPAPSAAPEVVMVDVEEDDIEEFSDMEGVRREGLFDSQHAPPPGEPDYIT
jgi:hypothetical protein